MAIEFAILPTEFATVGKLNSHSKAIVNKGLRPEKNEFAMQGAAAP
jgi:hypothetical protein